MINCTLILDRSSNNGLNELTFVSLERCQLSKVQWQKNIRNEDLCEQAGQEPVAKQILRRKRGWIEHTLRKPVSSTTRQALTWNPHGKRKKGRPRNSWRRDTEAELKLQGTNWTGIVRAAQNRVRRRGVVDGLCCTCSDGHKSVSCQLSLSRTTPDRRTQSKSIPAEVAPH